MSNATINAASSKNGNSSQGTTAVEKVTLGQEHTPEQIVQFLRKGQTSKDTMIEHLKATSYPLPSLSCLLQVGQDVYTEVMTAQAGLLARAAQQSSKGAGGGKNKTVCRITREEFRSKASAISVVLDGCGASESLTAGVKEFSTGSFGWFANGKAQAVVDGKPVTMQVNITLTVVGSKELAQG